MRATEYSAPFSYDKINYLISIYMKKVIILLLLVLPLMVTAQRVKRNPNAPVTSQPRNVIFIVGDGMGTAQVYSSIVAQGTRGSAFLRFPYSGFSRT